MAEKRVYTVIMRHVKPSVVVRSLEKYGQPAEGPIDDQVKRLVDHIKQLVIDGMLVQSRLAQCDICQGWSDVDAVECPYCGDTEVTDEPAGSVVETEGEAAEPDPEPAAKEPDPPQVRTRSQAKAAATGAEEKAEKPATKPGKGKGKGAKKKAAGKPSAVGKGKKKTEAVVSKDPAVESADPKCEVVTDGYTEKDLNDSVARLAAAAVDTAVGLYKYGQELQRIHDLGLWKLRLHPGKSGGRKGPLYTNFEHFCRNEMKISRQHAYRLMAVTKNYTKVQLEQYGLWKLNVALKVPEELRAKLLGDGSESGSNISEQASRLARGETESRGTPRLPADDKRRAVSVAIVPGIKELPMFKRPGKEGLANQERVPARSLQDDPWCELPLTNDVKLTVRLTRNDKGEILAIIQHRRGKEKS